MKPNLKTQPNERRCGETIERHIVDLPPCCPITKNPQAGSKLSIRYRPNGLILEVQSLSDYIRSYIGGRLDVRSMEGMVQNIAQDAANAVGVKVIVKSKLRILPQQTMHGYATERAYNLRLEELRNQGAKIY